jgi:hypothetical protein
MIARELVEAVRKSARFDWTIKESVRAEIRVMVTRILGSTATHPTSRRRQSARCGAGGSAVQTLGRSDIS